MKKDETLILMHKLTWQLQTLRKIQNNQSKLDQMKSNIYRGEILKKKQNYVFTKNHNRC